MKALFAFGSGFPRIESLVSLSFSGIRNSERRTKTDSQIDLPDSEIWGAVMLDQKKAAGISPSALL